MAGDSLVMCDDDDDDDDADANDKDDGIVHVISIYYICDMYVCVQIYHMLEYIWMMGKDPLTMLLTL